MNSFASVLADHVRDRIRSSGAPEASSEIRLIFLGPPHELMKLVFDDLANSSGVSAEEQIPILLQVPREALIGGNPRVGESGWCDEGHLLDLRNLPLAARFVALIPPGEHSILSVGTTTDKFGVSEISNGGSASFETWWEDSFIQTLVGDALMRVGMTGPEIEDARLLVEAAARASDEVAGASAYRLGAWKLLSRLYSIDPKFPQASGVSVSLACGFPPTRNGTVAARDQIGILKSIADAMSDGFRTSVERLSEGADEADRVHLLSFLEHIRSTCDVATTFERATTEYYRPIQDYELLPAPDWWLALDVEKWTELLEEEPTSTGGIDLACVNALVSLGKAVPAIVSDEVVLQVRTQGGNPNVEKIDITRSPSAGSASIGSVDAGSGGILTDANPPAHKAPMTFKASAPDYKSSSVKVISLASWQPGILVVARVTRKFSPPRKPSKRGSKVGPNWETSLNLPGPGRYELLVFVSPGVTPDSAARFLADQADDIAVAQQASVMLRQTTPEMYRAEIEVDGNCQVEVAFSRSLKTGATARETCKVFIVCDDVPEVGCRSEFDRLIKANRRQIESFDTKVEIPVNRAVRSTMLQDWLLSDEMVRRSFQPIVMAEDYGDHWSPPRWGVDGGPILSKGSFISDPRPSPVEFNAPKEFLSAREEIAQRVRGGGDQSGVFETARLGEWMARDEQFASSVERYVDSYQKWLAQDPEVASWVDVIAVSTLDTSGRSLAREPVAIILSPLHPLRVGWHVMAQRLLVEAVEAGKPCPAASVLDPDCVPDILSLHLRSPSGTVQVDYLAVENGTDYWSVLWNGRQLDKLPERSTQGPFGDAFGINVGGISVGFSAAQVIRALDDVSDLLSAKPVVSVAISGAGGATDACNEGLFEWCTTRFQEDSRSSTSRSVGPRFVEVFDDRSDGSRPDEVSISNLSEDTRNSVRWFFGQPEGAVPDLGIIAQLDMFEPRPEAVDVRTPLSAGGMIRHRIRRQLPRAFLAESRQSTMPEPTGDVLPDKVATLLATMENLGTGRSGLQFAPNVHEVQHMLQERRTDFVAVSSAAIDPACFLGGWLEGAYLWDFDLPSYSHRAGDTNGYYLLSQVTEADRDALSHALARLPGCDRLELDRVQDVLLEVARRGIPTIKGLAGDDAGATGDLGVFVAARLLQDRFRGGSHKGDGLLPVLDGSVEDPKIVVVVPVDPFLGYISDLSKALGKDRTDLSQLRPDLVVVGIDLSNGRVRIKITPVEVKCRPTSRFSSTDAEDALDQAKALSSLLSALKHTSDQPKLWALAYQHLLLSIIGFGLRVYSQHGDVVGHAARWSEFHELIARAVFDDSGCVEIDTRGRLIVLDDSPSSRPQDYDNDGFDETIIIGREDAGRVVAGDPSSFYDMVRARISDWGLMPDAPLETASVDASKSSQPVPVVGDQIDAHEPDEVLGPRDEEGEIGPVSAGEAHRAEAEPDGSGVSLEIGKTIDGFRARELQLNISDTRLNQLNIGVVGDLGTGKTQLLKSLIVQIARSAPENRGLAPRFLIFDYKRDYSSPEFVAATGARVVRPHRIPLNLFDTRTSGDVPAPWFDRFRFFADVLGKIYSGIGTVQRDKLKRAVKEAYDQAAPGICPTLRDVHTAYHDIVEGRPDSPMSIIGDMLDMEIFEEDQSKVLTFDKFLDGVVVIALDALGQDDHSKNMLVAVMLNMFYENMLKTPKRPFVGQDPQLRAIDSYLLVDEADNIMRYEFDVLRRLLLQGREFGTGVILASQYLRHFKAGGTDYREPLLTWFIHKVPNVTASELSALGLSTAASELAERVKSLGNHQCLYKSFNSPGEFIRGYPFFELMEARERK